MVKEDWKTAAVKRGLIDEIERLLKTQTVRNEGITNVSQFVDLALRDKIATVRKKRFEHVNMYEDHVKILDNNIGKDGRIISVYFNNEWPWCEYCEEDVCVHIQYAWEIPEVRDILKGRNIKPPPSRLP